MKKNKFFSLLSLLLLLSLAANLQAQAGFGCSYNIEAGEWQDPSGAPCVNTIVTAVPFLRIVPDARAGSMGDVGIATSPDPNAMHFNSSKLAFAEKDMGVSVTYTPWLQALGLNDVYMAYLSGFRKFDDLQSVGFSLRYFSLGDINFTDENGQALGTGRPNEFEVAGSYARKLGENFSAAVTAKFVYSNLAAGQQINNVRISPGTAGAADVSFTYRIPLDDAEVNLGMAITNIGTKITYTESINRDFIPANLGIGGAYTFLFDDYNKLTIAGDVNKLLVPTPCLGTPEDCDQTGEEGIPDYREQSMFSGVLNSFSDAPGGFAEELRELMYSVGMEYWYDDQFAIRAGFYSEHRTKGNRKFFTVGLGLKYNVFGINFSYLAPTTNRRNPLDNTLRFSLLFDLDALSEE
jgi:hypothetical protein